jgi:phosphoserine phosphatase
VVNLCEARGLTRDETPAIADGDNDLAMLPKQTLGAAFHARSALTARVASADGADLRAGYGPVNES